MTEFVIGVTRSVTCHAESEFRLNGPLIAMPSLPCLNSFSRLALLFGAVLSANAADLNTSKIEELTGMKGTLNQAESVFKVSAPRKDIPATVEGWRMPPFMGLTSWAAFKTGNKSEAMVMGDIVLFEDEVNAAMSAALDHGLQVTALHNHFFFDHPKVYFMHIGGEGSLETLAGGVHSVFDTISHYRSAHSEVANSFVAQSLPAESSIRASELETVFGAKAQSQAGMAKFVFGREATMQCGCTVGKEMGVNTWAAFAGSDDNAVVDGDFVVTADELQAALKSLRADGVNIVAIHSHMTEESPRLIFFHYWGRGKAIDLAKSVSKALPESERKSPAPSIK
ncbi:MAG TPA: DUF1259 domain-containing protein [Opitutaceae bacterium]